MAEKTSNSANTIMSWGLAALVGFLAFVLLLLFGTSIVGSVFLGGLIFVGLGGVFAWLFLRPLPPPGRAMHEAREAMADGAPKEAPPSAPTLKADPAPTVPASAPVKPSAPLAGQEELATRKGQWRYDGGTAPQPAPIVAGSPEHDTVEDGAGDAPGTKPQLMSGPRAEGADDLKQIKGIGPKLETLCHDLGVYHFDQVAAWSADEVAWVDANLEGFKGRVSRDEWVSQAKVLADGGETEFSKKVGDGGVYD